MKNRTEWIDFAKGLCIILIVTGHIINGYVVTYSIRDSYLVLFSWIIYLFHVHVFFFIAGMFFRQSYSSRGTKDFIIEKSKVILYPYFIWSIIQGAVEVLFSRYTATPLSMGELLGVVYRPISQFWFLYSLFVISILFALCAAYGKRALMLIMIISPVLYMAGISTQAFDLSDLSHFIVFFTCGILYEEHRLDQKISALVNAPVAAGIAVLFVIAGYFSFTKILLSDVFQEYFFSGLIRNLYVFVLNGLGVFMIIVISRYLTGIRYFSIISRLGYYSIAIYCAHGIFGSGCRIVLNRFFNCTDPMIVIPTSVFSGILFPVILYKATLRANVSYVFVFKKNKDIHPCPY